jgi:hypothetical protein
MGEIGHASFHFEGDIGDALRDLGEKEACQCKSHRTEVGTPSRTEDQVGPPASRRYQTLRVTDGPFLPDQTHQTYISLPSTSDDRSRAWAA